MNCKTKKGVTLKLKKLTWCQTGNNFKCGILHVLYSPKLDAWRAMHPYALCTSLKAAKEAERKWLLKHLEELKKMVTIEIGEDE